MNETAENAVYVTTEADNDSKLVATFTFEYYKTY